MQPLIIYTSPTVSDTLVKNNKSLSDTTSTQDEKDDDKKVEETSKVDENSVFIALSEGARDGNDFAKVAFENGAKFLILSKRMAIWIFL